MKSNFRPFRAAFAALALLVAAMPAHAGAYSDALARCMNDRMSDADRVVMMKWFYGALGAHPQVRDLAAIDDRKFEAVSRAMGQLFERLIVRDCRAEAGATVKNEGASGIESAFSAVGQFAARGLFGEPAVIDRISDYTKYMDMGALTRALMGGSADGASKPSGSGDAAAPPPSTGTKASPRTTSDR